MNNQSTKIITRFPPSPTGFFHIGSARTALFNYLFAKQTDGEMIIRIEDTDKERSKEEYEKDIFESLLWLGLEFDKEKVMKQSERTMVYKKYLKQMLKEGKVFEGEESKNGKGKVIRFKNPNKEIVFDDIIRGEVKFDTNELGDFVIAKNLEEPLYHLTAVVDDFETKITHIIRGEDHISNTPRQILLQEAIGASRPTYAHLPLILAPDKSKLSKRHGAVSLGEYKKQGYLPKAILNYLALLGWNPGIKQEIFILDELIKRFDLKKVQKGGAIFNVEKLKWINKEHLKLLSEEDFKNKILEFGGAEVKKLFLSNKKISDKILPVIKERVEKLEDINKMFRAGDLSYYFDQPNYEGEKILWKEEKSLENTKKYLIKIIELLNHVDEFSLEGIKAEVWNYATEQGRGSVLWPMRYALSGKDKSPDPFVLAEILGKEETIKRLQYAIDKINSNNKE